ncbi:Squamosa promoter binding-like protein [Quillaja saponaria]|uniref:Squamosa promoter binding-like protein n=1 Tax=Quillaja saponaria TaxID=32244 RepID=A0AAD7PJN9_QUISA|nr:Squamosa promoter binding-like protein [Quillaja saponaria]KAJ7957226.1 Squamosa promoter binding-like protein [Quillaja saponaria]
MDWNLKAPSWDLTELEQATLPNIATIDGSGRFGIHSNTGEFSVDLKLGQVSNSGNESVQKWKESGVSKMASSPSGSSKRARAVNNGNQTVSCLVDGCNSDLTNCRDYHRRHKVCELHSKTPQVTIAGQKQRFCQQCSRFHSLEEFDEGKRSCRKRLDGHNRRRRKPQPEPLTRSGSFVSNYQGTQLLPFSSSNAYPSAALVNPAWAGIVNSEGDARLHNNQHQHLHLVDKQNLFLGSSSSPNTSRFIEEKQFSFLQNDSPTLNTQIQTPLQASISQPLLRGRTSSTNLSETGVGVVRNKIFCDIGLTSQDHDSPCALSLLSSPQTQASGTDGLNLMMQQPNSISFMHPLGLSLHGNNLESVESSGFGSNGSNCHGMYNMGSEGPQHGDHDAPHPFPFHWE